MHAVRAPEVDSNTEMEAGLRRLKALVEKSRVEEARVLVEELAAKWPESPRVQHWHRVLQPPKVLPSRGGPSRALDREYAWLREHAHEYPGRWLAIYGDRLIAADPDLRKVVAAARSELGDEGALLVLAPDPEE